MSQFVRIRFSDFVKGKWYKIQLFNQMKAVKKRYNFKPYIECDAKIVDKNIEGEKVFTIVLPYKKFETAYRKMSPEVRKRPDRPIKFELMITKENKLVIKNMEFVGNIQKTKDLNTSSNLV